MLAGIKDQDVAQSLRAQAQAQASHRADSETYIPVAMCLNAKGGGGRLDAESETLIPTIGGGFDVAHALTGEGFDASEDGTGRGTPLIPIDMRQASRGATMTNNLAEGSSGGAPGTGVGEDGDPAPTLSGSHMPALAYVPELAATMVARSSRGGGQTNSPGHQADRELIAFSAKDHGADAMEECAPTLRAGGHANSHANAGVMPAVAYSMRADAMREGTAKTPSPDAEGRVRLRDPGMGVYENLAPTMDTGAAHAVAFSITPSNSNKDYNAREVDKAQALTAGGNRPSARGGDLIASMQVRRLTPRECERLQGFADDYTLVPHNGKPAADGPRYKALGNSWAVPCARWIGERIQAVENIHATRKGQK